LVRPEFDPGFSTPDLARLFSAESLVETMSRVEASLAVALADVGTVPAAAAADIVAACDAPVVDPGAVLRAGWEAGSPVIPLLDRLRSRLSPESARFLHLGATSQDIVDTAFMLLARQACDLLRADLQRIAGRLRDLAVEHRDTPMVGRTLLQRATPTTFGLRVASWLEPVLRAVEELSGLAGRLPVQLGGPVGVLAEYGVAAVAVTERFAADLGLVAPRLPWHGDRWPVAGIAAVTQQVARTMAKIGLDLALLSQNEVAEVHIRAGGSSSMPGKRNPIDAVRAVAAAEVCAAVAGIVTGGRPHELERAVGAWQAEWFALPVALQAAGSAVSAIATAVASLRPDVDRMAANLGGPAPPEVVASARRLVDAVLAAADALIEARR
jgi:3-carboxy-cis,cis-muconate cycloisomerase